MTAPVWVKQWECRFDRLCSKTLRGLPVTLTLLFSPTLAQALEPALTTPTRLDAAGGAIAQATESERGQRFGCRQCVRPEYPQAALDAAVEGSPEISFEINQYGEVIYAYVTGSSGSTNLDWAALEAIIQSKFTTGGEGRIYIMAMNFSLADSECHQASDEPSDRNAEDSHQYSHGTASSRSEDTTDLGSRAAETVLENTIVIFSVDDNGSVVNASISQSSGNTNLDQTILQTVRQTVWLSENQARFRRLEAGLPFYPQAEPTVGNGQGRPKVEVRIDENGNVISARIVESSGDPALDAAALEAVVNSTTTSDP